MPARPIWFGPSDRPLFGWLHLPGVAAAHAAVLCPPLGRDYLQAHYALRRLARRLEAAGLSVLRFDYDGTGDSSGSSSDPGRVEGWLASVASALGVVRAAGARRVALVGMRLGATLASEAAGRDGAINQLVLWDPSPSGRTFLNEQRALAALSLGIAPTRPDGSIETPGLLYDAATVAALRSLRIDATDRQLAHHTLVLIRPGGDDASLRSALDSSNVEWSEATGQAELIDAESPNQMLPDTAIERISAWLNRYRPAEATAERLPEAAGPMRIDASGTDAGVTESPVFLGPNRLFSFVSEPTGERAGPTIVFLSVANEHHIGPNRLWVDLARRLARMGLRSVRVDLSGLGDSPVRAGQPEFVSRTPLAFDDVEDIARAVSPEDPSDIVLVGLCSAGYQALDSALALHPRGVVAINPLLSFQPPELTGGGSLDPRRRIALPRGAVVETFHHEGRFAPLRRRFPNIGWRLRLLMVPGQRPSMWLRELTASGVDLLLVCADREARPFQQGTSARTLENLASTGLFHFEFIPELEHGLLREDHRAFVSNMVVDHLVRHFGPTTDPATSTVPAQDADEEQRGRPRFAPAETNRSRKSAPDR